MTDTVPEIIKARQAAALIGCNYKSMLQLLNDGVIPAVKVGNSWRIAKAAVYGALGLDPDGSPSRRTGQ